MTAECPFCDFEGSSREVEAHISGKSDEAHEGRVGSRYRGLIEASHGQDDGGVSSTKMMVGLAGIFLLVAAVRLVEPADQVEESERHA